MLRSSVIINVIVILLDITITIAITVTVTSIANVIINIALPVLLCASLRRPVILALGATLEMSPDTPNSAARVSVRRAEDEVGKTRV